MNTIKKLEEEVKLLRLQNEKMTLVVEQKRLQEQINHIVPKEEFKGKEKLPEISNTEFMARLQEMVSGKA